MDLCYYSNVNLIMLFVRSSWGNIWSNMRLLTQHAQTVGSVLFPPAGSLSRTHSSCYGWSGAESAHGAHNDSRTSWAAATRMDPERQQAASMCIYTDPAYICLFILTTAPLIMVGSFSLKRLISLRSNHVEQCDQTASVND